MDYIENLRMARLMRGLKQTDIGEKLNISKSAYSMYETRQRKMSIEMFAEVCRILDVSADEVLGLK